MAMVMTGPYTGMHEVTVVASPKIAVQESCHLPEVSCLRVVKLTACWNTFVSASSLSNFAASSASSSTCGSCVWTAISA